MQQEVENNRDVALTSCQNECGSWDTELLEVTFKYEEFAMDLVEGTEALKRRKMEWDRTSEGNYQVLSPIRQDVNARDVKVKEMADTLTQYGLLFEEDKGGRKVAALVQVAYIVELRREVTDPEGKVKGNKLQL